ncbi:MAG: Na/Pi symporter [Ferruginibacter sp.]
MSSIYTWKFLAGLGLFLYGLSLMEQVTKAMAGRPFKLFLRKHTNSLPKAIIGGTFITGLIESSSVIILMLMSFVSAGIISFRNAFGVLIGSNLGTTIDSWFIGTVGFTINLQSYSLPVIALTSIAMFFLEKRKRLHDTLYFIFSLGILLLGFGFMKEGAEQLVIKFNIAAYADLNLLFLVLTGFILTVIIQSSSATVAITLTALHANALSFPAAAAVIIGSEVGTTIKFLFSSIKGSAGSKMLAWGDLFFNLFTAAIAYLFLFPIIYFIQKVVGIREPMLALVFFQSFINLLAIVLFLPFIRPFSNWLERIFSKANGNAEVVFDKELPQVPELVPAFMIRAANNILTRVLAFHSKIFEAGMLDGRKGFLPAWNSFTRKHGSTNNEYLRIKETEGDYLKYCSQLNDEFLSKQDFAGVERSLVSIRQCIHAAKSVHDIREDLKVFRSSANTYLFRQDDLIHQDWETFLKAYNKLFQTGIETGIEDALLRLKETSVDRYNQFGKEVMLALSNKEVDQIEASTLLNVYQEMLSSKKALIRACAFLKSSANVNGAPGMSL